MRMNVLDYQHPNTLSSMVSLALTYMGQGRSDESEPYDANG